jgi:hypothetical protein
MRNRMFVTILVGMMLLVSMGYSNRAVAEVKINVGINVPPPPPLVIPAPPPVVVIPHTYVYFPPEVKAEILFYHGYWYRPYEGHWYRARGYNGPWGYLAPASVPRVLIELPPDYRHVYPGHRPIPYGEYKKNWRRWERDRYWERDKHWREARHEEQRGARHEEHREGHGEHNEKRY